MDQQPKPPVVTASPPDPIRDNLRIYEQVMEKCLMIGAKIASRYESDPIKLLATAQEIAFEIFNRFFEDQATMVKGIQQSTQYQQVIDEFSQLLGRR